MRTAALLVAVLAVVFSAGCTPPAVGPKPQTYAEALAVYESEAKEADRLKVELAAVEQRYDDVIAELQSVHRASEAITPVAELAAKLKEHAAQIGEIRNKRTEAVGEKHDQMIAQKARVERAWADKEAAAKREGR
jgi:hypothetical protein